MASHTKPASVALQLMGVNIFLMGLPMFFMGPWAGGITTGLGLLLLYKGGKSTRQRIAEDQGKE